MGKRLELRMTPVVAILFLAMLFADRSGVWFVTLLAALLHELGHLIAAKCLHIPIGNLHMDFLGARLEVRGRMLSYGEEWLLCAAGPLASLTCAAAGSLLWRYSPMAEWFSCASLLLGVLNLLPIRTFDGGRMLESALSFFLPARAVQTLLRICSFFFLFLLWAVAVYFLLKVGDGLSLFCFSMSLFHRFFDRTSEL